MRPKLNEPWVREARFWEKLGEGKVRCGLCYKRCPIASGGFGACGVRYNENGTLYTLVYGLLTAANVDPIEKKPLMHFNPGSAVLSISTAGCNFMCSFCQNWTLSQSRRNEIFGEYVDPEELVRLAKKTRSDGVSYTYNEPTIFYEYMYDVAKIAKREGLFNTMVTNGYITEEALAELSKYMDASTVDFKGGGRKDFYVKFMGVHDPEPIFQTLLAMKEKKIFVEITNLVIPKYGEDLADIRKLARWIVENLGDEAPFHLLRFYPHYKLGYLPPTDVKTMEKLAQVATAEGLKHVYLGNVPGHKLEHTYCPKCKHLVVRRYGFYILEWKLLSENRCPNCGYKLNIVGEYRGSRRPFEYF
ncbi:MAG: AmmeMemoRadiSam system radical SAM enzyme [Sulfolobales archaeon]|nr:AmmeMemoRadiSam system radical SAM enzyme [Sulfolobales archaeon]MCX8208982.1 AmmeMemoRadiSam system radical SAM enzyme [Sulfolobales archaeon]MDW8010862.1 AmmeMemoRadiSam system radical SAM enzyme [Sulfolobales archaeon]